VRDQHRAGGDLLAVPVRGPEHDPTTTTTIADGTALSPRNRSWRGRDQTSPNTLPIVRRLVLTSMSVAVALATSGCLGDDDESEELDWHKCKGGECATLEVPLDYDDPDSDGFQVALFRIQATNSDKRIGPLLFNFGGPGEPGISNLRVGGSTTSASASSGRRSTTSPPSTPPGTSTGSGPRSAKSS
jgi:hypothetical protein